MPTVLTHSFVGAIAGYSFSPARERLRTMTACLLCGSLPDIDAAAFALHIPYASTWGHRGFTHSVVFALVASCIIAFLSFRGERTASWLRPAALLTAVVLSHGALDALTNGGRGVAFLSPFVDQRFFFPWTPVKVAPIGIRPLFTHHGVAVLVSEFVWIWIPLLLIAAGTLAMRWISRRRQSPQAAESSAQ